MNRFQSIILCLFTVLLASGCLIRPPEPEPEVWNKVLDFETIQPYEHMLAAPTELLLLTRDEFLRLNINKELVERRPLNLPFRFLGRPMLSENVFVRLTRLDATDNQSIEFHLTKNPNETVILNLLDYVLDTDENLVIDANPRYTGAFNATGTEFLLPTINFSNLERKYVFLLFSIDLDPSKTRFEEVKLKARVEADELPAGIFAADGLANIKHVNGFFYVTSLNGTVRIGSNGDLTYPIPQLPIFDFFAERDTVFAAGFGNDLHVSLDNGASFVRRDSLTDLQMVEIANDMIFTHQANGFPFKLADDSKMNAREVSRNSDFPDDFAAYKNIVFFRGDYFMTVQKELWSTPEIFVEED